jgi:hypothetical protein
LQELRRHGWKADVVERWIPRANIRFDRAEVEALVKHVPAGPVHISDVANAILKDARAVQARRASR